MSLRRILTSLIVTALVTFSARGQEAPAKPDLSKQPTLYVVGYAHLDTQWRWEYPRTIIEYLPSTMHDNFALFGKYPHYIFNFSGANRYRMMKEYFPQDFAKVQQFVREGRWFPSGSSMEESDVNSPSAESIVRQILYGSHWFRNELGRSSAEYMLPDSFGFPSSLPTILAHSGIRGFSTQKLPWGSAADVGGESSPQKTPRGIPFNVGLWEGPDGSTVIAAMNPGEYSGDISWDLTSSTPPENSRSFIDWPARVKRNGETGGLFTDYHYYGVGDVGGAPREPSVIRVEEMAARPPSNQLRIISATAEQMFVDIKEGQTAKLPRYKGELELTNHSAGSLTSQSYHKRWNRKNELLADAAEKASVAAMWLGLRDYPLARLNDAWALVMGGQFHDNAAGTSTPKAYEFSWNDDLIALNQFESVAHSANQAIAANLDTRGDGTPVVIHNPLAVEREDVVEASIPFEGEAPRAVRVFGPDGKEVASQILRNDADAATIAFIAKAPSAGYAVYSVRFTGSVKRSTALKVSTSSLENQRYRISLNESGDVASIVDKQLGQELLTAPMRLAFQTEKPFDWPAWNMDWKDREKPPRAFVSGEPTVRIVEQGRARVAVEVTRESEGSRFVQTIRLASGDAGNRVEFLDRIDWKTPASSLKATFPLTASNPIATYNWGVGTIERGNNDEKKFEVASHEWFDLSDRSGSHGVTILSDAKYGSDKPDDSTLRLTLLYTPGLGEGNGGAYYDQTSQDFGHHEIHYGLASHAGNRRKAATDTHGLRLSQPLRAYTTTPHEGALGKSFSFLKVSAKNIRVMALKKAEASDEIVVRLVELDGTSTSNVRLEFPASVVEAREVNGQEDVVGKANLSSGALVTSFKPFQLRAFALRLAKQPEGLTSVRSQPLPIEYARAVASRDGEKVTSGFSDDQRALPAEMLPREVQFEGIRFHLGDASAPNALLSRGQTIQLPAGSRRVHLLAASASADQRATFAFGDTKEKLSVPSWGGYIGQWDNRIWVQKEELLPPRPDAPPNAPQRKRRGLTWDGLAPAFVKKTPIAWYASHHQRADGSNEPYSYSYLFGISLTIPEGAETMTLPDNQAIRIMAITVSDDEHTLRAANEFM